MFKIKVSNKTKKGARSLGVFLFALLVILMFLLFVRPFTNASQSVQSIFNRIGSGISNTYNYISTSKGDLERQVSDLQSQIASLTVETAYIDELEQNIVELQGLLEYTETTEHNTTTARVIAHSFENEQKILIDKGASDGIKNGLAVVVANGQIIGTVGEVNRSSATVILIEDRSSSIPAAILGTDRTVGLVEGQSGYLQKMAFIPQDAEIHQGDVVVTSGLNGNIPPGLVIGLVSEVLSDETALFQEALIESIYPHEQFRDVLIIDPIAD
ncbi:MAG: rod shape-determining protein MreC [bacterium]